ncbi:MAG: alpha/beta fold hydrolase [Candidatus Didemnitutus sp.]|nr:alpha/beta fold hydrolase [Candidatus Didemnitutus sp.]
MRFRRVFASYSVLLCVFVSALLAQQSAPAIPYGSNPSAGAYAQVNGVKLYYEIYGEGPALLMIHGNGGSISGRAAQIEFFSPRYRVIAVDSRCHGKSEVVAGELTYELMAEDLNALLDHLQVKSACIFGQSDGGIIGLLLAIHHPDKVGKLAIMGANLNPAGAYPWVLEWVDSKRKQVEELLAQGDKRAFLPVRKQHLDLLANHPHIPLSDLEKITAPVLVMAGDKDVIRPEHTQQIFEHLAHAHLAIFPGATHGVSSEKPALFDQTLETFFHEPFTRPDSKDYIK